MADVGVFAPPKSPTEWPNLSTLQTGLIVVVNVGSLFVCWFVLRVVYPPPKKEDVQRQNQMNEEIERVKLTYQSLDIDPERERKQQQKAAATDSKADGKKADGKLELTVRDGAAAAGTTAASTEESSALLGHGAANANGQAKQGPQVCLEGDSAGDYSAPWTSTFDLQFVILMVFFFVGLCIWTELQHPELWHRPMFWVEQLPKLCLMMGVSLFGGALCRYFCTTDEKGYIVTSKGSVFKVNYTRKLQHFAAYLVPLLLHTRAAADIRGPLTLSWGNWVTMLGFLCLIKPLRENAKFFMLQFNALDRPEDRPHTLSWIVGGNILPGAILIVFFRWLYSFTDQGDMSYIFIFITGIGDGFAEPVGIYLGKHKYWTASCFGDRRYQRSLEGSACVFISSLIFCSVFYYTFHSVWEFWTAMIVLPPLMTYVEATSPHTIDTPALMGAGGLALWIISRVSLQWK